MASHAGDELGEAKSTNAESHQSSHPPAQYSPEHLLALRPATAGGKDSDVGESEPFEPKVKDLVSSPPSDGCVDAPAPNVDLSEIIDTTTQLKPLTSPDNDQSQDDHNLEGSCAQRVDSQDPEKKKKKKKSSGKNKKPTPSGFEEYYADPPMTPDEYNEELHDIYHHSRTFVERIEQCIQRYRARRKLDESRANIFSKYMTLGGIDSGLKAFTGGFEQEMMEESTASEIATIQARDIIRGGRSRKYYDPADTVNWIVDFEGVVKCFLSHKAPRIFGIETQEIVSSYCGVVRNFLNYVLSHEVCPEYKQDIVAARKICDVAEKELSAIKQVSKLFPGDFNKAASTLCGGYYGSLFIDNSWTNDPGLEIGMTVAEAQRVFMTAVALKGSKIQSDWVMIVQSSSNPNFTITKSEIRALEIVGIYMPNDSVVSAFGRTKDIYGTAGNIKPLGLLEVKHWENPDAADEDLADDEEPQHPHHGNEFFWLEGEVLEHCFVGMKFVATVHCPNVAIKFFDSVTSIHCSFFTVLPNEMMDGWREPIPNPRPAPTVDNPNSGNPDEAIED